jgi:beta-lactam-binding protein with PASTA domain
VQKSASHVQAGALLVAVVAVCWLPVEAAAQAPFDPAAAAKANVAQQPNNPKAVAAKQAAANQAAAQAAPAVVAQNQPPPGKCAPLPEGLVGMKQDDAARLLRGTERFRPVQTPEHSSLTRDTVTRVGDPTPIPGSLLCAVQIYYSDGIPTQAPPAPAPPPQVAIQTPQQAPPPLPPPNCLQPPKGLAGMNVKLAVQQLRTERFIAEPISEPSTLPRDRVTRLANPRFLKGNVCAVQLYYSGGSLTRVPPLKGATREEASGAVSKAGLQLQLVEEASKQKPDRVFKQVPDPGTEVRRGSIVTATLATPLLYGVPLVVGMQYKAAVGQLGHFAVERRNVASLKLLGEVVDQAPRPPARLPGQAAVRVDVSDGSRVLVPPVEKKKRTDALAVLEKVGLKSSVEMREGDLAPGIVATQEPKAKTEVARGTVVSLVVSTGLEVPSVIGQPIEEAKKALDRFNVETSTVHAAQPEGEVVGQDVKAPARRAAGARVHLDVSDGAQVLVPPVKGKREKEAQNDLEKVGLIATIDYQKDLTAGIVATQDPIPGTAVLRGSAVGLVVGKAPLVPTWVWYVGALTLLAGATVLFWPVPKPKVSARVDFNANDVYASDVNLAGPEIQLVATVEPGESQVVFKGEPP